MSGLGVDTAVLGEPVEATDGIGAGVGWTQAFHKSYRVGHIRRVWFYKTSSQCYWGDRRGNRRQRRSQTNPR